jgi:hypothetical protein
MQTTGQRKQLWKDWKANFGKDYEDGSAHDNAR